MIHPSSVLSNLTIRSLVLDTPVFSDFDPYFTEFVLRQGVQEYVALLGELLGPPLLQLTRYLGDPTVYNMKRFYVPVNEAISQMAEEQRKNLLMVMLTDTSMATMLFVRDGRPTPLFYALYDLSIDYDPSIWRSVLRQYVKTDDLARQFGLQVNSLFGNNHVPTQDEVMAFHAFTQEHLTLNIGNVPTSKCESSDAAGGMQNIFNPESLN